MNLIVRFFLSLCVLLLSGYSHVHANRHETGVTRLAMQNKDASASSAASFVPHNDGLVIKYATSCPESYREKMEVTDSEDDDEDDELIALERYLAPPNYFTSLYCTPASGYFFSPVNNRIPFRGHFSICSSNRHILLRVIRI